MKTSLLISTYNSPHYLRLSLMSIQRNTRIPDEIVIADDGSKNDTRELIDSFRKCFSCPIVHVWQEDKGFRKSLIMNKALAKCTGDYIIQIDGDIITEQHFIEDHCHFAKVGYFYAGSRCLIKEELAKKILREKDINFSFFKKGIEHRFNMIRLRWLSPLFFVEKHSRGCNISYWRSDIYAINGYDERMEGNGAEDTDMDERLERYGIKRRHIKFSAIAFHVWHKTRFISQTNGAIMEENRRNHITRLDKGISNYI
ncbi:MAG: glycosyltransferase family 2 protein [Prevotella sp.]|nr:glycosyltransferase family 2 protein [Prevotella sp.]